MTVKRRLFILWIRVGRVGQNNRPSLLDHFEWIQL